MRSCSRSISSERTLDQIAMAGSPRYFRITAAGKRACTAEARRLAAFVDAARDKRLLKRP